MSSETHRRTILMIMSDGRPRITRDVQRALTSKGLRMDGSEISQALQALVRLGVLSADGRGSWDHPQIYQLNPRLPLKDAGKTKKGSTASMNE